MSNYSALFYVDVITYPDAGVLISANKGGSNIRCIVNLELHGRPVNDSGDGPLTRYINVWVAHAPGMPGTFSLPPPASDPDMHHGTCVTHVPWCMPGSLSNQFRWSRWREKRSRHSRRMRNPQFYVSGKRPMGESSGRKNANVKIPMANVNFDGLVQDCRNSSALAMELLQSCTKPSIWSAQHYTFSTVCAVWNAV